MSLSFTPPMKKRLTPRTQAMLERSLRHFPELKDKPIVIGYTRANLGSATVNYRPGTAPMLVVRLNVRKLTYQTIGHELTHLVQGLTPGSAAKSRAEGRGKIPAGEKACDIWTLARHPLFCDDSPSYLRMPRVIRDRWTDYSEPVRRLCITAIEKRKTHRRYIRWLEAQFRELARRTGSIQEEDRQLKLFL